jgi:16S rRNA (guanine527-N7)-methyltransferase
VAAAQNEDSGSAALVLNWRIDQWFPDLSPALRASLKLYYTELLKFNKTVNLIGVKTLPHADAIHFADSILAQKLLANEIKATHVYDFGSGNGFPGVIFAMMMPGVKFTLIDSDLRKSEFLKHIVSLLKLKNAEVLIQQVEKIPEGSVQCAISRGFAPIAKSLLMTRKTFAKGGIYYHLKGEEWASEVAEIPTQLCSFWEPSLLGGYKLPIGEVKFSVVKSVKIQD